MTMFLVCFFLGWLGVHKFIEGKIGMGILYLLTFGLFGIGWLIDCIIYFTKLFQTKPIADKEVIVTPQTVTPTPTPVTETTPIISEPITPPKKPSDNTKTKTYKVTGMSHYLENINSLACENPDYDLSKKDLINEGYEEYKRIYKYEYYPTKTELVPEPDNPYDPNAVKVIVDGVLVGYIKAGSCSHVLKILKEDRIIKIDCEIGGGKYKYLIYDDEEDTYDLEKDETSIFVHLSITEK